MELTRRDFLKLLGVTSAATAAGALGASTIYSVPDHIFERVVTGPKIETWKTSVCTMCPGGCGVNVRLVDSVPVRVVGNPLYPINKGAVCPMAEAAVEELFHPDRIQTPLKRVGNRGDHKWEAISWEEALQVLSSRVSTLIKNKASERFVLVTRDDNTAELDFIRKFMEVTGSPNLIIENQMKFGVLPVFLSQGLWEAPAFDLANADYILNFGANVLDDAPSPIHYNQLYAHHRDRGPGHQLRIVHVDSFMSRTAVKSSEWVPINPGTMAAFALGLAHVIIRDGTYDKQFINKHAFGFSRWKDEKGSWHEGFKSVALGKYYPEKVEEMTGVPAQKVVQIARDFAASKSAVAMFGGQASKSTNGFYTQWTVYCLNALKGNLEKPGGVLFPKKMVAFGHEGNASTEGKNAEVRTGGGRSLYNNPFQARALVDLISALRDKSPFEVDTLVFHRSNPLFDSPYKKELAKALTRAPFIVSTASFFNDTTRFADMILPEPVWLEKWDLSRKVPGFEFLHVGVQQPVIEPLYDTRQIGDALIQVADSIGRNMTSISSGKTYKDYIATHARDIYLSGEGSIVSKSAEVSWISFLKKRGWQPYEYSTFDDFWNLLLEKGGWWDPFYPEPDPKRIFKTPSGKFEFFSQILADAGEVVEKKLTGTGDERFLPHFDEPRFDLPDERFPYNFMLYQVISNQMGRCAHLSLLQEMAGLISREYWKSWVEVNPATAALLEIDDGDPVKVTSVHGYVIARAKLVPSVKPDLILMPFGMGQVFPGGKSGRAGVNPLDIVNADMDYLSKTPSWISTKVRLDKVGSNNES